MALHLYSEFYYMAHYRNLPSILEHGILSHDMVERCGISRMDISDPGAQRWRALPEPVFGRTIHSYVPLYFTPRNPMLYKRRALQNQLVILSISAHTIKSGGDVLFTDGNAASRSTVFSRTMDIVGKAAPVLESVYWHHFDDGSRLRCAEALVHRQIPTHWIARVACNDHLLAKKIRHHLGVDAVVDRALFF